MGAALEPPLVCLLSFTICAMGDKDAKNRGDGESATTFPGGRLFDETDEGSSKLPLLLMLLVL